MSYTGNYISIAFGGILASLFAYLSKVFGEDASTVATIDIFYICLVGVSVAAFIWAVPRLNTLFRWRSHIRQGIYVEIYSRNDSPVMAIFRHRFHWKTGSYEIRGNAFTLKGPEYNTIAKEAMPWESDVLYPYGTPRETKKGLVYTYRTSETDDHDLSGMTWLSINGTKSSNMGYFVDVKRDRRLIDRYEFSYLPLTINKKLDKKTIKAKDLVLISNLLKKAQKSSRQEFSGKYSGEIAERLLDSEHIMLLMQDDEATEFQDILQQKIDHCSLDRTQPTTEQDSEIFKSLRDILPLSHCQYSNIRVASAVRDRDGRLHFGVNVENAAYPLGSCAEQNAISSMVTAGGKEISEVYLISDMSEQIYPCGGCQQRIAEFARGDVKIHMWRQRGSKEVLRLSELSGGKFVLPKTMPLL